LPLFWEKEEPGENEFDYGEGKNGFFNDIERHVAWGKGLMFPTHPRKGSGGAASGLAHDLGGDKNLLSFAYYRGKGLTSYLPEVQRKAKVIGTTASKKRTLLPKRCRVIEKEKRTEKAIHELREKKKEERKFRYNISSFTRGG